MIIGLNGYIGSGKDVVGKLIQAGHEEGFDSVSHNLGHVVDNYVPDKHNEIQIQKWAAKLKQICGTILNVDPKLFEDQEYKKTFLPEMWNTFQVQFGDGATTGPGFITLEEAERFEAHERVALSWLPELKTEIIEKKLTVREFLQKMGTDACRDNIHSNIWVNALMSDYTPEKKWIITDTRFPNEAKAIKDAGGIMIRINRGVHDTTKMHISETALDDYEYDYVIDNNGTYAELLTQVFGIYVATGLAT